MRYSIQRLIQFGVGYKKRTAINKTLTYQGNLGPVVPGCGIMNGFERKTMTRCTKVGWTVEDKLTYQFKKTWS